MPAGNVSFHRCSNCGNDVRKGKYCSERCEEEHLEKLDRPRLPKASWRPQEKAKRKKAA